IAPASSVFFTLSLHDALPILYDVIFLRFLDKSFSSCVKISTSMGCENCFTDAAGLEQAEAQKHCVAHAAPDRAGNVLRRPDFLYQHRIDADDNHNQERLEAQDRKST